MKCLPQQYFPRAPRTKAKAKKREGPDPDIVDDKKMKGVNCCSNSKGIKEISFLS